MISIAARMKAVKVIFNMAVSKKHLTDKLMAAVAITWLLLAPTAWGQVVNGNTLAPFGPGAGAGLNAAWAISGLPDKKIALSRFEWTTHQGEPALKLSTDRSYGVVTHAWSGPAPTELAWRWQLTQAMPKADIATKGGDDAALKVCVMFRQPLEDIPFFQRTALALARAATGQDIPSATLCYLWDSRYPAGTRGANPYSARLRYMVLTGSETQPGQWQPQRRRIADDFATLFGTESATLPPIMAVAVGADSDNTQSSSVAYVTQLRWLD